MSELQRVIVALIFATAVWAVVMGNRGLLWVMLFAAVLAAFVNIVRLM